MGDDRERAARAARRNATYAGAIVRAFAPKPALHPSSTPEQRVAAVWPLTKRLWLLSGRPLPSIPRHELPGEIFVIDAKP